MRDRRRDARHARPGQLQVHDKRARGESLRAALAVLAVAVAGAAAAADLPVKKLVAWKGGKTPALELKTLEGKPYRLADRKGSVVLVNYWATWCEPCREEMPAMQKLRARMAGRPFEIVAVNFGEGAPRIREFLEKTPVDFTMLVDVEKLTPRPWGVRVLPTSFLVDPDGQIRYSVIGEFDWAAEEAVRTVESLMKK